MLPKTTSKPNKLEASLSMTDLGFDFDTGVKVSQLLHSMYRRHACAIYCCFEMLLMSLHLPALCWRVLIFVFIMFLTAWVKNNVAYSWRMCHSIGANIR